MSRKTYEIVLPWYKSHLEAWLEHMTGSDLLHKPEDQVTRRDRETRLWAYEYGSQPRNVKKVQRRFQARVRQLMRTYLEGPEDQDIRIIKKSLKDDKDNWWLLFMWSYGSLLGMEQSLESEAVKPGMAWLRGFEGGQLLKDKKARVFAEWLRDNAFMEPKESRPRASWPATKKNGRGRGRGRGRAKGRRRR